MKNQRKRNRKHRPALAGLCALLGATSCTTQYIPIEKTQRREETRRIIQRDTIYMQDTLILKEVIYKREKGDSVLIDRLRQEVLRSHHKRAIIQRDTVYIRDSIYQQAPPPASFQASAPPTHWINRLVLILFLILVIRIAPAFFRPSK